MRLIYLFLLIFLATQSSTAQTIVNLAELQPDKDYDNVLLKPIANDENASSYVIWVKDQVKAHRHVSHSEMVYVLEGEIEMTLGDEKHKVSAGDFIFIPKNTIHSAKVLSNKPAKVLSIQTPQFFGKDRIFEK